MQKTNVQVLPSRSGQFALVTPAVDFFMVGGLTLLLIPLALLPVWEDEGARTRAGMLVFSLLFVLNFPHFIHGYQLLYPNYLTKLLDANSSAAARLRLLIAGIVSPLVIIAFLIYGSLQPTHTTIAYGANAVLFLTGWHYVKQGYGVLMTLSARQKVVYSAAGRRLLLINAYVAWVFSWILYNASFTDREYFGIAFRLFSVPDELNLAIRIVFFTWTLFALVLFVLNDVRKSGLSVNGMLAYLCSVYVWVVFANTNYILLIFIPALHSLQYLVVRVESSVRADQSTLQRSRTCTRSHRRHPPSRDASNASVLDGRLRWRSCLLPAGNAARSRTEFQGRRFRSPVLHVLLHDLPERAPLLHRLRNLAPRQPGDEIPISLN